MSTRLNPTLFQLLENRFGETLVSNEGEALSGQYKHDPIKGRVVLDVDAWGETYRVNCPYCNETKQRLYVNHRYGVLDKITMSNNSHMARCFNEECVKREPALFKDLFEKIFGLLNASQRQSVSYTRGRIALTTPAYAW